MSETLFALPEPLTVPVHGEAAAFPVGRIFCVGRNYAAHAAEMGVEVDREKPFYFTKSAANAVATGATVPYPQGTENFHYEMELALAIGTPVLRASVSEAEQAIYGYACALDMTRRDLQLSERKKQRPWSLGKDLENGTVLAALTKAANWGAVADQRIWLTLDGEVKQDATLAELVWSPVEIICHLSQFYTLRPGDLILTGTPAGVGPVTAGQHIEGGIDGLANVSLTLTQAI